MKTTFSITLALGLGLQTSLGQDAVHDAILQLMMMVNHLEQMRKTVETIQELRETKDRLGDAASIHRISGARETLLQFAQTGIGQSRTEIATLATSSTAVTYQGEGLYQAVGGTFVSRDGQAVSRPDVFKPEAAIFQAVANHDAVHEDVMRRRQVMRTALRKSLMQLQAAETHAEVQKVTGVMLAEVAELEATDRELVFSAQQAVLLDIQNRADKERQQKATSQEQAREMNESLRHFTEALVPPSFISSRP